MNCRSTIFLSLAGLPSWKNRSDHLGYGRNYRAVDAVFVLVSVELDCHFMSIRQAIRSADVAAGVGLRSPCFLVNRRVRLNEHAARLEQANDLLSGRRQRPAA